MSRTERLDPLRQTAAIWFERARSGSLSAQACNALRMWLSESPEHVAAYRSIEGAWAALEGAGKDPTVLELRQLAVQRLTTANESHRPLRWAMAATLLIALGATLWFAASRAGFDLAALAGLLGESTATRSFATNRGDRLTVTLDDGSHLTLNTDTQLDVSFSKKTRTVRLRRGQALFEVARDPSRPFSVQTQYQRFVAVGTAFDVRIDGQQVKVTMLEGTVRAEGIVAGSQTRMTITAGQQLIANPNGLDGVHRVDSERETGWRRGRAIFDNATLGEAIAELNRYSATQIRLADPRLADLRLSGTFATGQTSAFVEAVTAYFPIQIQDATASSVTLRPR